MNKKEIMYPLVVNDVKDISPSKCMCGKKRSVTVTKNVMLSAKHNLNVWHVVERCKCGGCKIYNAISKQ